MKTRSASVRLLPVAIAHRTPPPNRRWWFLRLRAEVLWKIGQARSCVCRNSPSVSLVVYGGDDDFDLELRVISGMQTKYDTLRVVNCINGGAECIPY